MKTISSLLVAISMVLVASCSPIYGVQYDFDGEADFTTYQTYDWLPAREDADIDTLDINRVKKAVNGELQDKGLRMTSDNPSLLISGHLGARDIVSIKTRGRRRGYRRIGGVSSYHYEEGSLTLIFVDATSNELVWQGTANAELERVLTPEKREKLINGAVQRILKNFPPPRS